MISSEQTAQLFSALALAQAELEDAAKDKTNPAFKSKYADITAVLQAARPVYSKHGVAFVQGIETAADMSAVSVTTRLCHKSGEWIQSTITVPIPKKDAQGVGNGSTYGRRYGLAAMIAIGQDDDDGNSVAVAKTGDKPAAKTTKLASVPTSEELEKLKADFQAAQTPKDISDLVSAFTKLPPAMQAEVLPIAQEARKRAGL